LDFVVEPWFLGGGKESPAGKEFAETQGEWEAKYGVKFVTALSDLPPPAAPRLALISGRTADNPRYLTESIASGATCVYLEKPGAPTVAELEQMRKEAEAANVEVLMGYNKNGRFNQECSTRKVVYCFHSTLLSFFRRFLSRSLSLALLVCKYVRKTREFASGLPGSHVTFVSNNAYENTPASLGECFERNAEGMLKNMAIHELALLVSFYDVSVDNIASVTADKSFSSLQTLPGPSGKMFTDFDKIKFTIKTKTGNEVSVQADRCGGTDSFATVTDKTGKEVFRYYMPDDEDKSHVKMLQAKYPTAMPYFFTQDPDYITVKERVAKHTVDGSEAEGVATIGIAVETLKVAEYLTPMLQAQLK
jgi:hypothetical protein